MSGTHPHTRRSLKVLQPIFVGIVTSLFVLQSFSVQAQSEYPPEHPINTRCLPNSPCLSFPSGLIALDRKLQAQIDHGEYKYEAGLGDLRWYTEEPTGIAILLGFGVLLFLMSFRIPHMKATRIVQNVILLTLAMGLSDYTSSALKEFFGRLKPHVEFYNPHVLPALSFPSNHAFNTAAFFVFGIYLMSALQERFRFARALFLALITFWLLCIGYSRVLLGQHYPLDVLAGYVFGSLYALTLLFLMRILMRTLSKSKFWRHRLP